MSHDVAFAAFQSRKRAEEAAAPPRVTWRKVSPLTGGGWSGLGAAGALVWVGDARPSTPADAAQGWEFPHAHEYGRVTDGKRVTSGLALSAVVGKRKAAALLVSPVLSVSQLAALEYLCAGGRSYAGPIHAATGAGPNTLTSLCGLGLVTKTTAGARGSLYHLTALGRDLVCTATENDSQGGPTMNATDTAPPAAADSEEATADLAEVRPDPKPASNRRTAAAATVAAKDKAKAAPKKPPAAKGPTAETKALYADLVKRIKALVRGPKTEEKTRYLRVGNKDNKTIAYVNFPGSKHVRVCIPHPDGEIITKVGSAADVDSVVAAAQARIDRIAAPKSAAEASAS